jgi:H+/Cl- antiporter ClcA
VLPLTEPWYRKLLWVSMVLGTIGGLIAVVYSAITGFGIDQLFGEPTAEAWSGRWWWIPLVAVGAIVVTALRSAWSVPEDVPGAIAMARSGWVDPNGAPALVMVSAISLFVGASLGPSFGIVVAGGGLGAWVARRSRVDEERGAEYSVAGMAGSLGGVFSAPLFGSILASELSPLPKQSYVASFISQFTAATFGYVVFFGITGAVMLDAFGVDGYVYENVHLLYAVGLGLASVALLLVLAVIQALVKRLLVLVTNRYVRAGLGGAVIGVIAFALPLTATGGSKQLAFATSNIGSIGAAMLVVVLIGKMFAMVLSAESGFLGGTVFPILFLGGTAGIVVHSVFDSVPAALAVAGMIAAVPGGIIGAPVSFALIGAAGVGVGAAGIPPIGIAIITSHITVSAIRIARKASTSL